MPTRVTFEPGILGDAVKKAARVAPSRGGAEMDKAAGIIFDIDPTGEASCVIRATDTSTYYMEALDTIEIEGDPVRWRLSSALSGVISACITRGKPITLDDNNKELRVKVSCGQMNLALNVMPSENYPSWNPSQFDEMSDVTNLGEAIARVEWASQKGGAAPFCGVLIDGRYIFATDRYRMCRIPLVIKSVTSDMLVPAGSLGAIISNMGQVKVGQDNHLLVVQPNDFTQFKSLTLDGAFPAVKYDRFADDYDNYITFSAKALSERVQMAATLAGSNRDPVVELYIGKGKLGVYIENAETGKFGDWIDVPAQAAHDWCKIKFAPKYLIECLGHTPDDEMSLGYRAALPNKPVMFTAEGGYEVILAPRVDSRSSE